MIARNKRRAGVEVFLRKKEGTHDNSKLAGNQRWVFRSPRRRLFPTPDAFYSRLGRLAPLPGALAAALMTT